ncbi:MULTISPECIES: hypothetical protein [Leptospira]|uniref:hypothetical protein n=1 Tax=Leptospira TaxID=171 RepID=UPI00143848C2|nr:MULTISPECIES: hypothetical protein [Leptospira]
MFESERAKREETKSVQKLEASRKENSAVPTRIVKYGATKESKLVRLHPDLYEK